LSDLFVTADMVWIKVRGNQSAERLGRDLTNRGNHFIAHIGFSGINDQDRIISDLNRDIRTGTR